jgi:AraC-like DNA-binding protein
MKGQFRFSPVFVGVNEQRVRNQMDHINRLNRTIEYIEANLDKNIHLELLAGKFALSKYHFHRIFKALIGEPPGRYIEKRRLSKAASELIETNKR